MNATLFEGGKVHRLLERAARCGVDKSRQRGQWQMELGEVTCQRCVKFNRADEKAINILTADSTDERR